jgi:hypothetical protein
MWPSVVDTDGSTVAAQYAAILACTNLAHFTGPLLAAYNIITVSIHIDSKVIYRKDEGNTDFRKYLGRRL